MSLQEMETTDLERSKYPGVEGGVGVGNHFNHHSRRSSSVYETKYQTSLRHYLTNEALPNIDMYKDPGSTAGGGRPTLEQLLDPTYFHANKQALQLQEGVISEQNENLSAKKKRGKVIKFGWREGVLMRCLLNIWGVMLFLRISWVVGEAGIIFGLLLICLANSITFITALSMSAVATNGQIKAGGIYYMISRSLGPEFGGSIGLLFTLANSIAAATNIIGFVEAVSDMCEDYFDLNEVIPGLGGGRNDVRVLGTITLVLVLTLAIVGMDWVTRVQMTLLFLLLGSHVDFLIGVFLGPLNTQEEAEGFIGFNEDVFVENLKSDYRAKEGKEQNFFSVFAVFFTAVTGIVAGANLSGDLKDPGSAIPKGTLLAIGITFCSYVTYPILIGATVVRDATGNETQYLEHKNSSDNVYDNPAFNPNESCGFDETGESLCLYGTQNSYQVAKLMAVWGPLIYIGTFAATLSSAIASLVGAPRVLQALAKDRLYPYIHFFAVGFGANNDPVRGYVLVFIISLACILIGSLNVVSTFLTNCFLASYTLINYSCFHASLIKSPGWRPSFKYYNCWVSLFGGLMCLVVMFMIDWITALITCTVTFALYLYVSYRKPDVNWGSSTQAQRYVSALKSSLDLVTVEEHVKNYRPQILLMSGSPGSRPALIDLGNNLTKNISLLSCGNVVMGPLTQPARNINTRKAYDWFSKHKIRAFYSLVEAGSLEEGAKFMFQLTGLGKLRPNMILIGYKANWKDCDRNELKAYYNTLHEALNRHLGVAIIRVPSGLDCSHVLEEENVSQSNVTDAKASTGSEERDTPQNISQVQQVTEEIGRKQPSPSGTETTAREPEAQKEAKKKKSKDLPSRLFMGAGEVHLPKDVLHNLTIFRQKQKSTIDVWWLYDDGGLTLLLPHILTTRSQWAGCKLRVFALGNRKDEVRAEYKSMANLLAKFRIDYSDVIIIPNVAQKAADSSRKEFRDLIKTFKDQINEEDDKDDGLYISEAEYIVKKEKTNLHIRLRELLLENSMDSSLIVMTLPMPRKNSVSAPLYMAWLETLTKGMPPFLLIRGNQTSVLTYYS